MSNLLPTFNGVAAFGSIQSLASEYSLYPSVPQILIADGTLPQSGGQAANLILTNTYAPSFGPLAVPYLGYGPFNTAIDGLQINSIWTPSQPLANQTLSAASTATTYSFSLTSVSATIGQEYNGYAIYTGTITGGASNAFAGYTFTITGFSNAVNNGSGALLCIASTATTLTLANGLAIAESASANAASGTTVYTGTFTGGTSNAYAGGSFTIAGFTNGGNNGSFICTASSPTTITLLNSAGIAESHVATAQLNGNMLFSGASIFVTVAPVGNPDLDDSAYVTGLSVGMNTAAQANFSGSSSAMGVVAIETENSVGLPAGNTSTVFINQVIGLYTESLIGNFSNPDGVYNMNDHWNYHCAGMGWVGHATGTITNSSGIFMEGPRVPTGCTLTTRAGIYMQQQNQTTGGTIGNAYGIYEAYNGEKNVLGIVNMSQAVIAPPFADVALKVTGDASSSNIAQFYNNGNTTTPAVYIDKLGGVAIQPQGVVSTPSSLAVYPDSGGLPILTCFASGATSTASVLVNFFGGLICQPQASTATVALAVTGDAHGSDIQDWFTNSNTTHPCISISSTGHLTAGDAGSTAFPDFAGNVTLLSGNTTVTYSFANNYLGTNAPLVTVTPTSNPSAFYWVTYSGGSGAWTGFTVNIASAPGSNVVFNYHVIGQN